MNLSPSLDAFTQAHGEGRAQVVWTRIVDDLETPVSAFLKIGHGRPYAFLFESVEGGAWRGRYSIIALKPDLVWRAFGERAEIAIGEGITAEQFTAEAAPTLVVPAHSDRRQRHRLARRASTHGGRPLRRDRL